MRKQLISLCDGVWLKLILYSIQSPRLRPWHVVEGETPTEIILFRQVLDTERNEEYIGYNVMCFFCVCDTIWTGKIAAMYTNTFLKGNFVKLLVGIYTGEGGGASFF